MGSTGTTFGLELAERVEAASFARELFDRLPDVVFFVKDSAARYVAVNRTLVERCGARDGSAVIGRTTLELFPAPLGERYHAQDLAVLSSGRPLVDRLELHLHAGGGQGWCLTDKVPLLGRRGGVIGLAGTSRDLRLPEAGSDLSELAETVEHLQVHFAEPLRVDRLAARAGLSAYRFSRRIREIFQVSPVQLIGRLRVDAASNLLRTTGLSVAEVAQRCGFSDQSAFTRQFKAACGLTPTQYRGLVVTGRGSGAGGGSSSRGAP